MSRDDREFAIVYWFAYALGGLASWMFNPLITFIVGAAFACWHLYRAHVAEVDRP